MTHRLIIANEFIKGFGWIVQKIWFHVRHPLYKFPGPSAAAWSNAPYSYWFLRGRQPFVMLSLHEKYGSVVRTAPNELSFDSATAWKDIYGFRPSHKTFIKSEFYDGSSFIDQGFHGIATSRDPVEHAGMRRYLSHAFSERAVREQEGLVAEIVDLFVDKVGTVGKSREGIDLAHWLRMAMFDVTGSLAFGQSFDAVKSGESEEVFVMCDIDTLAGGQHPSVKFIHKALRQIAVLDTIRRFPWLGKVVITIMSGPIQKLLEDNRLHEEHCLTMIERLVTPATK
jgi:cytochrome P450